MNFVGPLFDFSFVKKAKAQTDGELGSCQIVTYEDGKPITSTEKNITKTKCDEYAKGGATTNFLPNDPNSHSQTTTPSDTKTPGCGLLEVRCNLNNFLVYVVWAVMKLVGFTTMLAGAILNKSIVYTIVEMAPKFNAGGASIGTAINAGWSTVRDVANMSFIFILLYTSIQLILGLKNSNDVRNLVVKIIIVALLINFSLFATKLVIDASNVIALTFYEAIAPGATAPGASVLSTGISNSLMRPLGLSSLLELAENDLVGPGQIITLGVMGSIMLLIATFIFAAAAILLLIRYVILVFVLILSPIAFVADIIPGAKSIFGQWKDALINQSFFPAVYFFLTWITIKIFNTVFTSNGIMSTALTGSLSGDGKTITYQPGAVDTLIQFFVVIAFLIATLVISKKMASKAAPGVDNMIKWATGRAGAMSFGFAGAAARNTFGRAGQMVSDSERLKDLDAQGGIRGMGARLALAAGRKTASKSFDLRATAVGKQLGAGGAQKGGYAQTVKDREKAAEEREKNLKPSAAVIADAERTQNIANANYEAAKAQYGEESEEAKKAKKLKDEAAERVLNLKGTKKEDIEKAKKDAGAEVDRKKKNDVERQTTQNTLDIQKNLKKETQQKINDLELELKNATDAERTVKQTELEQQKALLNETDEKIKAAQQKINEIDDRYKKEREDAVEAASKKGVIKSAQDRRKEARAKSADNSLRSSIVTGLVGTEEGKWGWRGAVRRSLNQGDLATSAQMRKNKPSVKDEVEKLLKENGDIQQNAPEEKEEESSEGGESK